LCLRLVF
jgi:hypothetical protein